MFIVDWWSSLGIASQIFYCVAIPATLILIVQTVLMLIGIGEDADGLGDGFNDVTDIPTDSHDGVFGDNEITDAPDTEGFIGLRIFTFRGIVAFFVVFGWVGVVMESMNAPLFATIPVSAVCGFIMMLVLALILKAVMKLRNDGNTDNRNAIGMAGKVHLTIPPSRTGEGKVHLMLQGAYVERNAVTDDTEAIPTGSEIIVVGTSGITDLVVKRK